MINSYTPVRKDRQNREGGGLLIYIHHKITFTENKIPHSLNNDTCELQSITLNLNSKKSLTIVNLYISPYKNINQDNNDIPNIFDYILSPYSIIMADINAHSEAWYSTNTDIRGSLIENIINSSNHQILNTNSHTRRPPNSHQDTTSPDITLISNNLHQNTSWEILLELSSDHMPILIETNTKIKQETTQNKLTYTNYNKANWPSFTNYIETNIQNNVFNDKDIIKANNTLTKIILDSDKYHIPKGRLKTKNLLLPDHIIQKIKKRNTLRKKDHTDEQIKLLNNQITKDIAIYKKNIWIKKLSEIGDHKTNTGTLWRTIKNLSNKFSSQEPNKTITFNNKPSINSKFTANLFNKQFTTNTKHQTNALNRITNRNTKHLITENIIITKKQVIDAIKNSKDNNSTGPDKINIRHLKHLGPLAIEYLTKLYNNVLNKNIIPHIWKLAKIIPIPKPNKDTNISTSYRPISLLSPIVKTLEKIILPYITNNISNIDHQHGFKKQHSTITALHHINNSIIEGYNIKPHLRTVLIALDMSKAFDTVNIHKLIDKIKQNKNIPSTIIKFTANYLKGRQGYTIFNNQESKHSLIKTGVPQGSVLSPALFNIYMSDLPTPLPPTKLITFADDITTYTQDKNFKIAQDTLQPYLIQLQDWTTKNSLQINTDKSTATLFTRDPCEFHKTLSLKINNLIIPTNKFPKILGITFDPKLTFWKHTENIFQKAKNSLNIIRSLSGTNWGKQKETLLTTYKAITRPVLEYASTVWSCNTSISNIEKLSLIQNNALRIVTGCTRDTEVNHLHSETEVLPMETHLKLHASQLVQKSKNPSHPLHNLINRIHSERIVKVNIFNPTTKYVLYRSIKDNKDIENQININIKNIHTAIVKKHIEKNSYNKILKKNAPKINLTEQSLDRETRRMLAQVRADKSPFLTKYLNKINPNSYPSPNCPFCFNSEHTAKHLFNCRNFPTEYNVQSLWSDPVGVSKFLTQWRVRMAGPV